MARAQPAQQQVTQSLFLAQVLEFMKPVYLPLYGKATVKIAQYGAGCP
jgi:hypothetical protein